jgi:hypothetical protein
MLKAIRLFRDHRGLTLYVHSWIVRVKWDGKRSYFGNGSTWFVLGNWHKDDEELPMHAARATDWRTYSPLYMHGRIDRIKSSEGTTDERE